MKNDCLFCAIIDGEIPSKKLYEDALCYAFYDIEPQAPVHFLVVPKEHICCAAKIDESNEAIVAHCFTVIAKLCKELGCESYRIVNNCGDQAGSGSAAGAAASVMVSPTRVSFTFLMLAVK